MPEITLYNLPDCDTMKQAPDKSVDIIICSLHFKTDFETFWKEAKRVRRSPASPVILLFADDCASALHASTSNKDEWRQKESGKGFYVFRQDGLLPTFDAPKRYARYARSLNKVYVSVPDFEPKPYDPKATIIHHLLHTYCPVGGTVLMPSSGSSEALMIAYKLGRSVILSETMPAQHTEICTAMNVLYDSQPIDKESYLRYIEVGPYNFLNPPN